MARVVFLGTPEFAVPILERVHAAHEIVAVITQPDQAAGRGHKNLVVSPVKAWASHAGLPVHQPASLRRDAALLATLRGLAPDVLILAAYGQILRPNVLNLAPGGCIGVHASLLPRWRGAAPIAAAIWHGDETTGITLMHTDAGMDTGPIIAQRSLPITPDDTTLTLTGKLARLGADLLIETLPNWLAGGITAQPQDERLATKAPPLTHEQGCLDFNQPGLVLEHQVRALYPWPCAWTIFSGLQLKVLRASVVNNGPAGLPGTVLAYNGQAAVATGDGLLILEMVQLAGKRVMPADEFVRGRCDFLGVRLGVNRA